ncbi:MAG: RNA polymerase factor sigma-54, partial [Opitutales bacterium]|nr:RNA polymerase factor sigma-54 [Opitutales bacterium]
PETVGSSDGAERDFDYDDYPGEIRMPSPDDGEKRDFFLNSIPDRQSLRERLINDAAIDAQDENVAGAFEYLVGALDERGFLPPDALEGAARAGFGEAAASAALKLLQESEPAGIGAFDMRGSLMLQLERKAMGGSLAHSILENRYELLMKRKVEEIAKLENCDVSDVENAIAQIAKLSTSPAASFEAQAEKYISPDLVFYKTPGGKWAADTPKDAVPRLRINPEYRAMSASPKLRDDERAYIKEKIRDGKLLMEALEMRQKTLEKIGSAIIAKQPEFFKSGIGALKPMTMADVAEIVGVHPTTVGRAVADKYAETPFGLLPLKTFFGVGYDGAETDLSGRAVKDKIAKIVEDESPRSPLSDSQIAEMLEAEGVKIARRTVAKYREQLGIAPKNLRKRF